MKMKIFLVIAILILASLYFIGCKSDEDPSINTCTNTSKFACVESSEIDETLCKNDYKGEYTTSGCNSGAIATCHTDLSGNGNNDTMYYYYTGADLEALKANCISEGGTWKVNK